MINITDRQNCCGCSACVQACPKQCISFNDDEQCFCYPLVNKDQCIDCGLCEKVCPVLNQNAPSKPLKIYAAVNKDERIRLNSSSGGIFTKLAEAVIAQGGVVFGARFNEYWMAQHDYTETIEGLAAFRGSKYVQSQIGDTYKRTRDFLKSGRMVLFSGTPCQIAGLKKFLRKDYDHLITIDIVCHGVPSPKVWSSYLKSINPSSHTVTEINMRSKERGWKQYSYIIKTSDNTLFDDYAYKSPFLQGFSRNYYLRPSCFACPAKNGKSGSDITLADFWGIESHSPEYNDNKGTSAVIIHSEKGLFLFTYLDITKSEESYENFVSHNPSYAAATKKNRYTTYFWKKFQTQGIAAIQQTVKKELNPLNRIINKIISILPIK